MIEVLITTGITAGSVLLFGYWFRYTCLLILSTKTVRDYAASVAAANRLGFLEVQARLREGLTGNLDELQRVLDRDYAVLTLLLGSIAGAPDGQSPIEARMLQMNYRCVSAWARVSRKFSIQASCRALEEMSQVVAHFANVMGELAAASAA